MAPHASERNHAAATTPNPGVDSSPYDATTTSPIKITIFPPPPIHPITNSRPPILPPTALQELRPAQPSQRQQLRRPPSGRRRGLETLEPTMPSTHANRRGQDLRTSKGGDPSAIFRRLRGYPSSASPTFQRIVLPAPPASAPSSEDLRPSYRLMHPEDPADTTKRAEEQEWGMVPPRVEEIRG